MPGYDYRLFEDNARLRVACMVRAESEGGVACWELNPGMGIAGGVDVRYSPCGECLRDVGIEPGDEFDVQ